VLDMNAVVGAMDILFVTLDTLRYDVARDLLAAGRTPNLAALLPGGRWEERHSPATFTYAAHQAFFAGFLPTPVRRGRAPRLFAVRFPGSETVASGTCVLDAPDLPSGLAARGYHTACVGGVGFFNKQNALGRVLPGLFAESHWSPATGVRDPRSFENQIAVVERIAAALPRDRRLFLFVNVAAIHTPNAFYLPGATADSIESHGAALEYVDRHLPALLTPLRRRGTSLCILCSDHGEAYGEDGYRGHRVAHPKVFTVPYAELVLPAEGG
jgi:arylsulfatase A-like enzyme